MLNIGNYCTEDFMFDNNIICISTNYIKLLTSIIIDIFLDDIELSISNILIYQQETLLCTINDFIINKINKGHFLIFVNFIKFFKILSNLNLCGIPIFKLPIRIECIFNNNINYNKSKYYCQGYLLYDNIITIYEKPNLFYNIGTTIYDNYLIDKQNKNISVIIEYDILNNIEIYFYNTIDIDYISIYFDNNLYFKVPIYLFLNNNKFMYDFNDFNTIKFKKLNIIFDLNENFDNTNLFYKINVYNIFNLSNNFFSRIPKII